ncbi:hypothetical protein GCM10009677_53600 [Sphaerisporangium rubeum]|uniref:Uncharacterized protein n=1 Tax=Sphaerisporangium rubeum TaxID=321317 RepID=A0A7X0M8E6_9ACTN|nr:hypothetical protein [Sphaerisporangium rubeum]MBB6475535.1 hypothetical protein [Sphaerisporangium rubeum]
MVETRIQGGEPANSEPAVPPPPWIRRGKTFARYVGRHLGAFVSGVAVAVTASWLGPVLSAGPPTGDVTIEHPPEGTHAKAAPCLAVRGHGVPEQGDRLVLAVQQTYPKDGAITFFPVVRVVGGDWQATVPLEGPPDGWFKVRAVTLSAELTDYLASVGAHGASGGTAGGSAAVARWTSAAMPPGGAIADSVDVQRGPGQIIC